MERRQAGGAASGSLPLTATFLPHSAAILLLLRRRPMQRLPLWIGFLEGPVFILITKTLRFSLLLHLPWIVEGGAALRGSPWVPSLEVAPSYRGAHGYGQDGAIWYRRCASTLSFYFCKKLLPSESFHRRISPVSMNCSRIQSVFLNVHKGQHEVGAVKGHDFVETWENDFVKRTSENYSGAGTTKRKELHGMTTLRALSGTWASQANDVILNTYEIKFICNVDSGNYSPFVLLTEARLDDDVANAEIELHLHLNKMVRSSVSPCGQIELNASQVAKSKLFHEFFFNGLFGKLFSHTKTPREFLLEDEKQFPWSSSYMYMLLPMESPVPTSTGIMKINWKEIDACISVVEFLRNIYSINCHRSSLTCSMSSYATKCEGTNIIHMANEAVYTQYIKGMVVLAVHTGRIYTVLDIMNNMCADSPFDDPGKRSKFNSFSHYYHQKYNIVLQHPGQPLLLVKQSHYPYNLLVPSTKYKDGYFGSSEKSNILVHIPPELLVHLNVSSDTLRSSYLLPSVMHRLESMMLACQLQQETCCIYSGHSISSSLILEAITTSRCSDNFSMERLELLGDSVLKYIVSCLLFLKYPMKSEGQLSEYRSWIVSNSTLHKLGTHRYLQGYIQDCPFDPRRWVAPGQISLRPLPCTCGVDTSEVPLEKEYWSEEASTVVGKACDKGHRWICSKTIADCVEALIGAYYVGGGLRAALSLLRWLGMDVSPEPVMIEEAKMNSSIWLHHLRGNEIDWLESKLDYRFSNKGLLLEAITHPSHQGVGNKCCYQRLEFLGDSVLGLLITWYLFQTHVDLDPGELSDLRSALISNENFAQATVRHNFEKHLRHSSEGLSKKLREYRKDVSEFQGTGDSMTSFAMPKAPKALGDLLESIAGAVLIDTDLNLDRVWEVFKPLLSPMVTPDKLELPPLHELAKLCNRMGYPLYTQVTYRGEQVVAELSIQLEEDLLVRHGCNLQRKTAKDQAALQLLKDLETRGISHAQYLSQRRQQDDNFCSASSVKICVPPKDMQIVRTNLQNVPECLLSLEPSPGSFLEESCQLNDLVKEISTSKLNEPDVPVFSLKKEKGGPRNALFELCAISKWPMPKFESTEQKFRTPIVLDGVTGFNSYTSSITLHIPNSGAINLVGEPRTDKKSSRDAVAFAMLVELQKQGRCIIKEPRLTYKV
ncbi:endoribonuclease Dicer homolog 3b-like isoform X2 [Phoenix dactylifera]|uniref:Endoribonuclease Dicer homolog 3b-like isoform X2 n=1 Tax=Phoenix dactylifera TaxID=42345 RepID=A0A8B8ZP63_PHODC|nr:endoribonuclease Dicer homolog 3b-like isoform X2 [Phoenix dactylifera]